MKKAKADIENFSDEAVLSEFVKRFKCDGAVLLYLDSHIEYGFGQWSNSAGRQWVKTLFKAAQEDRQTQLPTKNSISLKIP